MRRSLISVTSVSALLLLAACASRPGPAPVTHPLSPAAADWQANVALIADGGDNGGRSDALVLKLDTLGIEWRRQSFEVDDDSGGNLLAGISGPADAPLLLLGAHFDKVDAGDGVTDNASGSAVVLALAERFQRQPLRNHRVAVAFWDLEERGLLGSQAYISQDSEKPALYVNFDVFGWGDTLWMMTPDAGSPITASSRIATGTAGFGFSAGEQYPPTDHRAFLDAGWPAVSYSLVGADEIDGILTLYAGKKPRTMPKVMKVIHSKGDTVAAIDPEAAARGIDVVEAALRHWDAATGAIPAGD